MLFEPPPRGPGEPPAGPEAPQPRRPDEVYCPNRGALNRRDYAFCVNCGTSLLGADGDARRGDSALAGPYPVRLSAEYQAKLSRLSTFFRIILAIPVIFMVLILGGGGLFFAFVPMILFGGLLAGLVFVYWLAVLVRGRPVPWLFQAIIAVQRFVFRSFAYILLLTDLYPAFDGDHPLKYEADVPDRVQRRQLIFWKTIVCIPQFVVVGLVSVIAGVFVFIAWLVILFTGIFPKGLHEFVVGWLRWNARVNAYWMSLTDVFPAYGLGGNDARGGRTAYVLSAIIGSVLMVAFLGGAVALILAPGTTTETRASYSGLLQDQPTAQVTVEKVAVKLTAARDPYEFSENILTPAPGNRLVLFETDVRNLSDVDLNVYERDFGLKDSGGKGHDPVLVTIGGAQSPRRIDRAAQVSVVFELPRGLQPAELTLHINRGLKRDVKFVFR